MPRCASGSPFAARLFAGLIRPRITVLGAEFAGMVAGVGEDVTRFAVGDAVWGATNAAMGAHAEYVVVSAAGAVALQPAGLSRDGCRLPRRRHRDVVPARHRPAAARREDPHQRRIRRGRHRGRAAGRRHGRGGHGGLQRTPPRPGPRAGRRRRHTTIAPSTSRRWPSASTWCSTSSGTLGYRQSATHPDADRPIPHHGSDVRRSRLARAHARVSRPALADRIHRAAQRVARARRS